MAQATPQRGRPRVYDDAELLGMIREFRALHGRVPTMADFAGSEGAYPAPGTYVRRFGSWSAAVEAAGFERPRRGPRKWYRP